MPRLRSLPEKPVMRDLYKAQPASCKPLGELTEVAMRGPSPFTPGQRDLIAAYVSALNSCTYCHSTHAGVAGAFGVAPDLFKALLSDVDSAAVEERIKTILRYARKLTLSPARMTEADAAAVYEAGWGGDALYSPSSLRHWPRLESTSYVRSRRPCGHTHSRRGCNGYRWFGNRPKVSFANSPPDGNLVAEIWARHMQRGRRPNEAATMTAEQKAELVERFKKFREQPTLKSGRRAAGEDEMVTVKRSVHMKRGSWWQLPKGFKERADSDPHNAGKV